MSELLDGSPALGARYQETRTALSAGVRPATLRVAASVGHLGLVARLLCPAIGAAVLGHHIDLENAWWQPTLGVMPLNLPLASVRANRPDEQTVGAVLAGPVEALTARTAAFSLSEKVLRGNVESAVNGAVMAVVRARGDLSAAALALGRTIVADAGPHFRRRSCCLIYQLSEPDRPSYCGDCILPGGGGRI